MNAETPQQLQEFCQAACEAANRGGEVLLKWLGKTSPQKKGFRDLVTQADFESQQVIQDFLQQVFCAAASETLFEQAKPLLNV